MMEENKSDYSERAWAVLERACGLAKGLHSEFIMPEHLLLALADDETFQKTVNRQRRLDNLKQTLTEYIDSLDKIEDPAYSPEPSAHMKGIIVCCHLHIQTSSATLIDIAHFVDAIFRIPESWATNALFVAAGGNPPEFMSDIIVNSEMADNEFGDMRTAPPEGPAEETDWVPFGESRVDWQSLVTCLNDHYQKRNPLIGRERELERTIQVLCRRDKNNPLHVGEPGVGKTALVWGLAQMIEEGRVPERLRGSRIYMMDMTTILAGTQYRGEFEKRLKAVVEGIMKNGDNNIVYIDEIHMMVGAGATGNDTMDASNILKPYLEGGRLRFIGSTTYEEFNRQFSKSKGLLRRFQKIDIEEPTIEEACHIMRQLQPHYEEFHGVKYSDEGIDFAVEASARHISDRFLPDKAIDLIDETGAAMQIASEKHEIGKREIADVLAKICKVDSLAVAEKDDYERLRTLSEKMLEKLYGQDDAVRQVVESVQMAQAGLLDDDKPLASLLFVGPTGVGKTEVARLLARNMGVNLVRFDMSEFAEKHSVAKLIGSPAGYVGYEDGGLLTDAVRKSPNCVLLLDEIEKAHPDIYNILLQVMDYARLTDNKGRKADFHNVILIMTSNAGAQFASQSVGFANSTSRGSSMMKQVKRVFKPEFLNRLSGVVIFNDMDRDMATLILKKKLGELEDKLKAKNVTMELSDESFEHLLEEGFTAEYGAREMDRVIRQQLNPLLMREILFGKLRNGGIARVVMSDGRLALV